MATLTEIRTALHGRLDAIAGLECYRRVPGSISPPCAVVGGPERIVYDLAFQRSADEWLIPIRVYAARADDDAAQDALDAYLAPSGAVSVKAAIEGGDPAGTLGGVVDSVRVTEFRGYGNYDVGGIGYLGGEWLVEVVE